MKVHFHGINGGACWRCGGTVHDYIVDEYVTYVAATCSYCKADNMFYPPKGRSTDTTFFCEVAHRESQSPTPQTSEPVELSN